MLSLFGFGSVTSIILAFWTMLRSQRFAEHIDLDEERAIRQSLADHSNDSLGYFSTRRDRSALFAGDFSLADLPEVQRAVANLTRLGYTLRIRQQSETPADELASLAAFADEWRDGETERGFSMALGRMGDSADARTLHVEALFPAHDAKHPPPPAGLLSFVRWGANGISLEASAAIPAPRTGHRIHDRRAHA